MILANLFSKTFHSRIQSRRADERGMALVIAMVLLAMLAFLGTAALLTTSTEMDIAANERAYQMGVYAADAGAELSPRVIHDALNPNFPGYESEINMDLGCFQAELLNFSGIMDSEGYPCNDGADGPDLSPDIQCQLTPDTDVSIDVDRFGAAQFLPGGGIEFGAGNEGLGIGSASGGSVRYYTNNSQSFGPRNGSCLIQTRYRYVVGSSGGS